MSTRRQWHAIPGLGEHHGQCRPRTGHDAVQNDALARSVGAHLVSRVPARGRVLVRRLLAGKPGYRDLDAILLPHDFATADFDQRISQLLGGLLNERQHLEHSELDGVVSTLDVVDLAHLLVADEGIDQLEEPRDSNRRVCPIVADNVEQARHDIPA